ncbi:hypothetical protein OC834_007502, partial [Tilletia horrida]
MSSPTAPEAPGEAAISPASVHSDWYEAWTSVIQLICLYRDTPEDTTDRDQDGEPIGSYASVQKQLGNLPEPINVLGSAAFTAYFQLDPDEKQDWVEPTINEQLERCNSEGRDAIALKLSLPRHGLTAQGPRRSPSTSPDPFPGADAKANEDLDKGLTPATWGVTNKSKSSRTCPQHWEAQWKAFLKLVVDHEEGALAITQLCKQVNALSAPASWAAMFCITHRMGPNVESTSLPELLDVLEDPKFKDIGFDVPWPEAAGPISERPEQQDQASSSQATIVPTEDEMQLGRACGNPEVAFLLASLRSRLPTLAPGEWQDSIQSVYQVLVGGGEEASATVPPQPSADSWLERLKRASVTPSPHKRDAPSRLQDGPSQATTPELSRPKLPRNIQAIEAFALSLPASTLVKAFRSSTAQDAAAAGNSEDEDDDDEGGNRDAGDDGGGRDLDEDDNLRTLQDKDKSPIKKSSTPRKPTYNNTKKAKASTKKKSDEATHNGLASARLWALFYRFVLNLVVDAPTNPRAMALRTVRVLIGAISQQKDKGRDEDLEALSLTEKHHLRAIISRAIQGSAESAAASHHHRWKYVLDWMVIEWTHRLGVALDQFPVGLKFWDTIEVENIKAKTQEHRADAARRWMSMGHALGDVAFLPLLIFFGETFSFDWLRRLTEPEFGAFMEFLQTGDDQRNHEEIWAGDRTEAMVREAARAAAKWLLPTILAELVKVYEAHEDDDLLRSNGVLIDTEPLPDENSVVGLSDHRADEFHDIFPRHYCVQIRATSGLLFSTPPNAVITGSYKEKLLHVDPAYPRHKVSWLKDLSTYGRMLSITEIDVEQLKKELYPYCVVMGIDDGDKRDHLADLIRDTILNGPQPWPDLKEPLSEISRKEVTRFRPLTHYNPAAVAQVHEDVIMAARRLEAEIRAAPLLGVGGTAAASSSKIRREGVSKQDGEESEEEQEKEKDEDEQETDGDEQQGPEEKDEDDDDDDDEDEDEDEDDDEDEDEDEHSSDG